MERDRHKQLVEHTNKVNKQKKELELSKSLRKETSFESLVENGGADVLGTSEESITYLEQREQMEFWNCLLFQLDKWDTGNLKDNEKSVLEAVKVLLHNVMSDSVVKIIK